MKIKCCKTYLHAHPINALKMLRDETATGTALRLHCLYMQMQVVILQMKLKWPRITG